jgi:hypothetical protein
VPQNILAQGEAGQTGGAFADLCLETPDTPDLFCHATECTKHTFDSLAFRRISFRPDTCLRGLESAADRAR